MGRRTRAVLAATAVLCGTGGLLALGAAPAGADSSAGSSSGTSLLGGWTLGSTASGLSVFYEQPNFPIPATPTLEFNLGYTAANFNAGPVGNANASAFWPGPIVAGGGSQLPLLLDPYLQQYAGPLAPTIEPLIPNFGPWPVMAASNYPQGPPSATNGNGPMNMTSSTDQNASKASSSIGIVGGSASESALPAGMLRVQAIGSSAQDTVDNLGNAVSQATSTIHGIDFAGGLIHIGEVTSTATATSDGNQGKVSGTSTVIGMTVAGEQVSVDASGVHAANQNGGLLGSVGPQVGAVLSTAGISISLTNPTDKVDGASGQRQLDGLAIKIDLSTYDQNLTKLMAMLPSQLTSGLAQLPVPTPYKQSITLDFGWVTVGSAASPPFTADLGGGALGDTGTLSTLGSTGSSDLGLGGTGVPGVTPASSTTGGSPAGNTGTQHFTGTATSALFKGVGTGLILLGLLLAALLVGLLMRADKAVGAVAAAADCVGETHQDLG
ncbi:MAG: choice-of-anchor P family protein [Acidimicrobiales bacterium]